MPGSTIRKTVLVLVLVATKVIVKPRESALRVRMALWVVLVSGLARVTSLPRLQKIASFRVGSRSVEDRAETPARLAAAIDGLLSIDLFVFRRSCWKRALVLHRFLALNGIESRINFGVQKESSGTLKGHAWLEHGGRPMLEHDAGAYVLTFSLPVRVKPAAAGMLPPASVLE
jgi:hypothetical protein